MMIQQARNGGSMTPAQAQPVVDIATQLRKQVRCGKIRINENCQVVKAQWLGENWHIECSYGNQHECDYIWLSTGTKFDATTEPLLKDILETYPIKIVSNSCGLSSNIADYNH